LPAVAEVGGAAAAAAAAGTPPVAAQPEIPTTAMDANAEKILRYNACRFIVPVEWLENRELVDGDNAPAARGIIVKLYVIYRMEPRRT
jgi:hypothetical protein